MCSKLTAGHTLYNMFSQGCQKLDTFPKTAKQQHRPTSNSTSDSSETTEKDQERTDIPKAGRYQENDLLSQEGTGSDSASEGQAEYELITPESMVAASADHTVYTQVFFNLQVSSFDQYTFLPPPLLEPSNILDNWSFQTRGQDQQHMDR